MRNPGSLGINSAFCKLFKGDANDQTAVEQAIEGCIAVVVTINRPMDHDNEGLTEAAKVISAACIKTGVKRLIYGGGNGMLPIEGKYLYQTPDFPLQFINVAQDHLGAYNVYKNAGLEVTAVCPCAMIDLKFTGKYEIEVEGVPQNYKWFVGNREVADFYVKEIQNPQNTGRRISVSGSD